MSGDTVLVGRYRLDRQIGRGGMGQVWSALDTRLQRQVAVKTVDLATTGDEVAAARFQQEAHATAALSHPNIVTIFDNGVDGTTAYLVMELLSGPSLENLVRDEGPLSVDQALAYAQAVASALGAAHRAGVVHRDIKPSNLMLDQRGELKVVDFGIARLDQARTSQLTATATVIGSAPYLSPEQATGATATAQSDLYSLGCVLTTLLTGRPPYEGEHPLSVLHQHLSAPVPLPSQRRAGIPHAVDDLVAQLLAKSPEDRPASAADVASRMAAVRRGASPETTVLPAAGAAALTTNLPSVDRGATAPVQQPPLDTQPTAHPTTGHDQAYRWEGTSPDHPRRRGAGAVWALLVLLLAALATMWWFLFGGARTPTPEPTPTRTQVVTQTEEPTTTAPRSSSTSPTTTAPTSTTPTTTAPTSTSTTAPTSTASASATSAPATTRPTSSAPVPTASQTQAPTSSRTAGGPARDAGAGVAPTIGAASARP